MDGNSMVAAAEVAEVAELAVSAVVVKGMGCQSWWIADAGSVEEVALRVRFLSSWWCCCCCPFCRTGTGGSWYVFFCSVVDSMTNDRDFVLDQSRRNCSCF